MNAYAFKISTHIWLADQIADDVVANGSVTLLNRLASGGGAFASLPVDRQLIESIRRYRGAFLFGSMGADIYPDLIAGQMTTHPGLPLTTTEDALPAQVRQLLAQLNLPYRASKTGWQTDDWLFHMRKEAYRRTPNGQPSPAIAFAYGYLLHAAMDTWAHSYVNLFSGDLFSIATNQTIAARHTALETYINSVHVSYAEDREAAPGQLETARRLGEVVRGKRSLIAPENDAYSKLFAPTEFVRKTLFLNADTAEQHARHPGAMHVWAMWAWWQNARNMRAELIPIRQQIDQRLNQLAAQVASAEQAWQSANQAKNTAVAAVNTAYSAMGAAEDAAIAAADTLNDVRATLTDQVTDNPVLNGLLIAADGVLDDIINHLPAFMQTNLRNAKRAARNADRTYRTARTRYQDLAAERDERIATLSAAAEALDLKQAALTGMNQARDVAWQGVDDIMQSWQVNVEGAVDAYIRAYEETAREIMRPKANRYQPSQSVTWPLTAWAACWGPAFGLPGSTRLHAGCESQSTAFTQAKARLTSMVTNAYMPATLKNRIVQFDERLHESIVDALPMIGQLIRRGVPLAEGASIPGSMAFAAQMWDHNVSREDLAQQFRSDDSERNLPLFQGNSLISMLETDGLPRVQGNNKAGFEAMMQFTPIRNAVNLSKLALVNGDQLNLFAQSKIGSRSSVYSNARWRGAPLYRRNAPPGEVLMGAIRSIDGNHQWLDVAPALPRGPATGIVDPERATDETCRRFGYPDTADYPILPGQTGCASFEDFSGAAFETVKGGFRLWRDPDARKKVFSCVFQGPLSQSVCNKLGASAAPGYGCNGVPFPPAIPSGSGGLRLNTQVQRAPARAVDHCVAGLTGVRTGGRAISRPSSGKVPSAKGPIPNRADVKKTLSRQQSPDLRKSKTSTPGKAVTNKLRKEGR